jgi:hypothetical protein
VPTTPYRKNLPCYEPLTKIKKNEMHGVCSTDGGRKKCIQVFGLEPFEHLRVDGRMILKRIFKTLARGHGLD